MFFKKIVKFISRNYLISSFIAVIFLVVFIFIFKIASSETNYIYAKVKLSQGLWWASTLKSPVWLAKSLKKGETEYNLLGKPTAQILEVRYYPSDPKRFENQYDVYLTLKLSADFNKRTNKYLFKRVTIGVGSPIELEFPTSQVTGTVTDIKESEFKDAYVEKTVELRKSAAEPWELEEIKIGDKYFDGESYVFEVLDKNLIGFTASFYTFNKGDRGLVLPEVFRKNGYQTIFSDSTESRSVAEQEAKPIDKQSNIDAWFGNYEESLGFNSVVSRIKDLSGQGRPFLLYVYSWALHVPYITDSGVCFESDNVDIPPGIPRTNDEFENALGDHLVQNYKEVFKPELIDKNPSIFKDDITKNKDKLLALFHAYEGAKESKGMLNGAWPVKYQVYFSSIDTDNPKHIQFLKSSYLEILKSVDKDIGQLIQLLDDTAYKSNTIIVIKSDHGEEFFEHGSFSHQNDLYQELIHTPLIIKVPGLKPTRVNQLTQDIDVMPTILDLVGIDIPTQAQGKSLVPLMRNPDISIRDYQIAQKGSGDYVSTFRKGDWKLIMKDLRPIELYNLANDPGETRNVVENNSDKATKLHLEYQRIIKSYPIYGGLDSAIPEWIDEEKRERLKEEGYF